MPVTVHCPHCRSLCQVNEQLVGKLVRCGKCTQTFVANGASEPDEDVSFDFNDQAASLMEADPGGSATGGGNVPAQPGVFRLDIGAATTPGRVRARNEDSFLVQQLVYANLDQRHEIALVVLADGMGGHNAGDKASQQIIQQVGASLSHLLAGALSGKIRDESSVMIAQSVEQAIRFANQAVYQRAQNESGCRGMGATAAVLVIWDGQTYIGHVGDCRVYGYRAQKVTQVTRDQTLVERMVQLGKLTPEEALVHPARNEIAQAVGRQPIIEPAAYQWKLAPGDWLIVACDGLHAHVDSQLLTSTIRESPPSGGFLAHRLVDLANQGGGSDNCTVVAVRCY